VRVWHIILAVATLIGVFVSAEAREGEIRIAGLLPAHEAKSRVMVDAKLICIDNAPHYATLVGEPVLVVIVSKNLHPGCVNDRAVIRREDETFALSLALFPGHARHYTFALPSLVYSFVRHNDGHRKTIPGQRRPGIEEGDFDEVSYGLIISFPKRHDRDVGIDNRHPGPLTAVQAVCSGLIGFHGGASLSGDGLGRNSAIRSGFFGNAKTQADEYEPYDRRHCPEPCDPIQAAGGPELSRPEYALLGLMLFLIFGYLSQRGLDRGPFVQWFGCWLLMVAGGVLFFVAVLPIAYEARLAVPERRGVIVMANGA
jgi:hypothetical protein